MGKACLLAVCHELCSYFQSFYIMRRGDGAVRSSEAGKLCVRGGEHEGKQISTSSSSCVCTMRKLKYKRRQRAQEQVLYYNITIELNIYLLIQKYERKFYIYYVEEYEHEEQETFASEEEGCKKTKLRKSRITEHK